jgi:hypothetical protein
VPDADADRFDEEVTGALKTVDVACLAAIDAARADELFVAGRAAWQMLAGAVGDGRYTAMIHYAAAPFEVSCYVATWQCQPEQGAD